MKTKLQTLLYTAVAIAIATPLVYAASVHFKGGNPKFTDNGSTLTSCFSLSGLGNRDVTITVTAKGTISTTCTNAGGNAAPGQNKTPFSDVVQKTIPATEIKNGNVSVCLTTQAPPTPTAEEAGCPNNNWTTSISSVDFTAATVTVVQGGKTVLTQTFQP